MEEEAADVEYLFNALQKSTEEMKEEQQLRSRLSDLLTRTANALKGDPGPNAMHDWSDLPEVAELMVATKEVNAERLGAAYVDLNKKARELHQMRGLLDDLRSELKRAREMPGGDWVHRTQWNKSLADCERLERERIVSEAVGIVGRAFEHGWVMEDTLDALRALGDKKGA